MNELKRTDYIGKNAVKPENKISMPKVLIGIGEYGHVFTYVRQDELDRSINNVMVKK